MNNSLTGTLDVPKIESPRKLFPSRAFQLTILLTAIFDYLFYDTDPGLSVGFFAAILLSAQLLTTSSARSKRLFLIASLTILSSLISVWEFSLSNALVLLVLLTAWVGEIHFTKLANIQSRIVQSLWNTLKAPLLPFIYQNHYEFASTTKYPTLVRLGGWLRMALMPLMATTIFLILFSNGNAIFGDLVSKGLKNIGDWLTHIEIPTFARVMMWLFVFLFIFTYLAPLPIKESLSLDQKPPILLNQQTGTYRAQQFNLLLVLLNALFLFVNGIDAFYLWMHQNLPKNVTYSEFVHNGVYNLIATVILSSILLVWAFGAKYRSVITTRLKTLGLLLILQDLFLLSSVALRLNLYIEAYQLSLLRVGVLLFLCLVAIGFIFLTRYLLQAKTFGWLFWCNAAVTFCMFFVLQIVDLKAVVASYNVNAWEHDQKQTLDLDYLKELGPSAWPALLKLSRNTVDSAKAANAEQILNQEWKEATARAETQSWKSLQLHENSLRLFIKTRIKEFNP